MVASLVVPPSRGGDEPVTLNFVNADIEAVVKAVAEMTGRNFVLDPRVKGVINIVSSRPVPASLVYPTLLSALRLQGYAAVETDGITKIVPEADAKQHGSPVSAGPVAGGRGGRGALALRRPLAVRGADGRRGDDRGDPPHRHRPPPHPPPPTAAPNPPNT